MGEGGGWASARRNGPNKGEAHGRKRRAFLLIVFLLCYFTTVIEWAAGWGRIFPPPWEERPHILFHSPRFRRRGGIPPLSWFPSTLTTPSFTPILTPGGRTTPPSPSFSFTLISTPGGGATPISTRGGVMTPVHLNFNSLVASVQKWRGYVVHHCLSTTPLLERGHQHLTPTPITYHQRSLWPRFNTTSSLVSYLFHRDNGDPFSFST